jgi:hypothetical protein
MRHNNGHSWIAGTHHLGRFRHISNKYSTVVFHRSLNDNLRDFLAHEIPYYGMRYLGLEGVYGDQLETRLNVDLGKVRLAIY